MKMRKKPNAYCRILPFLGKIVIINSLDFQFPIDSGKNREAGTLMKLNFLFIVCLI